MEKLHEISLMLDFYGLLITKRQYEIIDMHYNGDYSLGEISKYLGISRQGVYDNIKKGKALLERYEEKLNLVKKYNEQKTIKNVLLNEINLAEKICDNIKLMKILESIKSGVDKLGE